MIPIEHSREGKHVVLRAWIRSISNKAIDPSLVEGKPGGVEISYDSSSIDEVAIVKMMVIAIFQSQRVMDKQDSRFSKDGFSRYTVLRDASQRPETEPK